MEVPISEVKAHLADLVRRAEAGDEVVLTRHGQPVAGILPVRTKVATPLDRKALLDRLRASWTGKPTPGPDAEQSQDFLYDEFGLPK